MFVDPIPTSERFVLKVKDIIYCRYYYLRDEHESVDGDCTADIRVVIRGLSWLCLGQNRNYGGGGSGREDNGSKTNPPPPTKTDRKLGAADKTDVKELGWRRQDNGLVGMG